MVASYTAIRNVELKMEKLFIPVILSFTAANLSVLLYFNRFVLDLGSLLEARYLIPIGGMLLGNALSGNVVGIGEFYESISEETKTGTFTTFPWEQAGTKLFCHIFAKACVQRSGRLLQTLQQQALSFYRE